MLLWYGMPPPPVLFWMISSIFYYLQFFKHTELLSAAAACSWCVAPGRCLYSRVADFRQDQVALQLEGIMALIFTILFPQKYILPSNFLAIERTPE